MAAGDKEIRLGLELLAIRCGISNAKWVSLADKEVPILYRKLASIDLMHSELGEMTQGVRTGAMDKHLPHFTAETVECGDAIVRELGHAQYYGLPIIDAIIEKMKYNETRPDHQIENRRKRGGKKI